MAHETESQWDCPNCGSAVLPGRRLCPNCGARMSKTEHSIQGVLKSIGSGCLLLVMTLAALALALLGTCFIILGIAGFGGAEKWLYSLILLLGGVVLFVGALVWAGRIK